MKLLHRIHVKDTGEANHHYCCGPTKSVTTLSPLRD